MTPRECERAAKQIDRLRSAILNALAKKPDEKAVVGVYSKIDGQRYCFVLTASKKEWLP